MEQPDKVYDVKFPDEFVWGAATASYQVEGAAREDGRGPSVWDAFCRRPGAVFEGHSGDVACDHYHRWKEDIGIMQQMGLQGYRFSIAWPRIQPDGTGKPNAKGLDFYEKLVDALMTANVAPYATLFHWDLPYELHCRGGWLNREIADWFAEYTRIVVERLGDRVKHWMTLNEPAVFAVVGYRDGRHAPGEKYDIPEMLRLIHVILLSHGRSAQAIRAAAKSESQVGLAHAGGVRIPASSDPSDIAAAGRAMFSITSKDLWANTWWLDPVMLGAYPEDGLKVFEPHLPTFPAGDMKVIQQKMDFIGCNIYHGQVVKAGASGEPERVALPPGRPMTAIKWPVTPEALYWGPRFFQERYGLPIYITENGLSNSDWVGLDGKVHDPQRIDYTRRHLIELARAIQDGVDVRGYFHWSLLDNFEWAEGYKERFGLVYVDYPTGKRILKDSAYWYGRTIASHGENLRLPRYAGAEG
jgi:beta-glucosidase